MLQGLPDGLDFSYVLVFSNKITGYMDVIIILVAV